MQTVTLATTIKFITSFLTVPTQSELKNVPHIFLKEEMQREFYGDGPPPAMREKYLHNIVAENTTWT